MKSRLALIVLVGLMTFIPNIIYAATGDAGEKIGTSIVSVLIIVGVFSLVSWVKSKNSKGDNNKPL